MKRSAIELASLSRLLDEALELPVEERATWIERLDAANETLKSTLRKMLLEPSDAAIAGMTGVRKSVDAAVLGAAAAAESLALTAGASIGPYELIREIGRGGMGAVWLARRIEGLTRRLVALKLPHPGLFHAELAQRIARERDILESLAHPNIARIYDAGISPAGQPYLALEFIEGTPITDYCNAKQLHTRERIALIHQVLDAMQYAHAQLVIHRDLKPANILVTDSGRAMLLDFGIAKLLSDDGVEETALTRLGGRALTPDYASPEQMAGRPLGTASDVYSLGVVIYELLSGQRPYSLSKALSIEQAFEQIVIARPSSVAADAGVRRALEGDLDTIVLKALKIAPAERYTTVAALADDLDRHLRGDPVLAQPDTAWYRLRKFATRNKLAVGAFIGIVAALAAGLSAALWQARDARREAARAEQVKSFALSMLDSADSDAGADVTTTAADLLRAAAKRVEGELVGQPAMAAELMSAIGYGLIGQDQSKDAVGLLAKAVDLSATANGPDHARTVEAMVILGEALYQSGQTDQAIALLKPLPERARQLHITHAQIDAWRWLSSAYLDAGNPDAAIAAARAAVAALPPLGSSSDRRILLDAFQAHESLANILANTARPGVVAEARESLRIAALQEKSVKPTGLLDVRTLLGLGLISEGRLSEGLTELKRAYADSCVVRGVDSRATLVVANLLGAGAYRLGDFQGALVTYQQALHGMVKKQAEFGALGLAKTQLGLAQTLLASKQDALSLPHFREAARLFTEVRGAKDALVLRARSLAALALTRAGTLDESDREFTALATADFAGLEKPAHEGRLATLRSLQRRHDEAISLARAAANGLLNAPLEVHAQSLAGLGQVLLAANRPADAIAPLEQAVAIFRKSQIEQSPRLSEAAILLDQARNAVSR